MASRPTTRKTRPSEQLPTSMLAREMVRLDDQIDLAARGHRWTDAMDLEDVRDRVAAVRSNLLRRHLADGLVER